MNQMSIIPILRQHFGTNISGERNVFKCHKFFQDNIYKILYVDLTDFWLKEDNSDQNLEKYIESILQKDYYSNAGPLQWNYYYIFVSDTNIIKENKAKKVIVEKNEVYARKYIMSISQLSDWLNQLENIGSVSTINAKNDLATIWIEKLRESSLDAVFLDNVSYKDGVSNYITGTPIRENDEFEMNNVVADDIYPINRIEKLKLNKYRPFPTIKEYNLGLVNIFKGSNGSGKTSLLEAVELMLCGCTNRNPELNGNEIDIIMKTTGNINEIQYQPIKKYNRIYRERDRLWYNNNTPNNKKCNIYERFNRYNFFNSDAAYQLSYGDKSEIKKAFEDIALGTEVNRLEERIDGFYTRFNEERKKYKRIITDAQAEQTEIEEMLKNIKDINDEPEKLLEELINETKKLNWKINESDKRKIITFFEKNITKVKYRVQDIKDKNTLLDDVNKIQIVSSLEKLTQAKSQINDLYIYEKELTSKKDLSNDELFDYIEKINILKRAEPYFKEEEIDQLQGLTEKINSKNLELDKLKKIQKILNDINNQVFITSDETFDTLENKLIKESEVKEKELKQIIQRINEQESNLNKIEKLLIEIKASAKEYLHLDKEATECPLCHAQHEKYELIKILETSKHVINNPNDHEIQQKLKAKYQHEIEVIDLQLESLLRFKNSIKEILGQDNILIDGTIRQLSQEISKKLESYRGYTEQLIQLEELLTKFTNKGLSEEEFIKIKRDLIYLKFDINNISEYKTCKMNYEKKIEELKYDIRIYESQIEKNKKDIDNLFMSVGIYNSDKKGLSNHINAANTALKNYEEIEAIICLNPEISIYDLERNISTVSEIFEKYKEIKQKKEEYEASVGGSQKKISKINSVIENNTYFLNNAIKACEVIEDIQGNFGKSDYLKEFIEHNRTAILEIFKIIHSPKEFENIYLNNDSISLQRVEPNELSIISEISAGQRAALALAIFFALNQKLSDGPEILLFDEPAVNIDDLNVLSFIDYLRELVIKSGKQIFLATANENFAYLLKKKFDFLGAELKEFIFLR